MAFEATYDQANARVNLRLTEPAGVRVVDRFTRDVSDGWAQSTSGHSWDLAMDPLAIGNGYFAVEGGVGRMVHDNTARRSYATTRPVWDDVEVSCEVTAPMVPDGGPVTIGALTRYQGLADYVAVVVVWQPNARTDLVIWHKQSGRYDRLAQGQSLTRYAAGHRLHLRVQDIDERVRARLWRSDESEPTGWHVQARVPGRTPGALGVRTTREPEVTSGSVSLHVDNLVAMLPGDRASLARSVDRIRWTPVRGAHDLDFDDGPIEATDYEYTPDATNHYRAVVRTRDGTLTRILHTEVTTPVDRVWMKWPARPFLNTPVLVSDVAPIMTEARHGLHPVIGRRTPVAVTTVRSARTWTLTLVTQTAQEAADLDLSLAPGDTIYLQTPTRLNVPGGYYQPGNVVETRFSTYSERLVELELTEVAAPGPDVTGANLTWQSILAAYPTWGEITEDTWVLLLERSGGPGDILVP